MVTTLTQIVVSMRCVNSFCLQLHFSFVSAQKKCRKRFFFSVFFCFFSKAWNNSRQVMFDRNVLPGNRHIISWSLCEAFSFLYDLSIALSDRYDWQLVWHHAAVLFILCLSLWWGIFLSHVFQMCSPWSFGFAFWDLREHNTSDLCPQVPKMNSENLELRWWLTVTHVDLQRPLLENSVHCHVSDSLTESNKHTDVVQKEKYLLLGK